MMATARLFARERTLPPGDDQYSKRWSAIIKHFTQSWLALGVWKNPVPTHPFATSQNNWDQSKINFIYNYSDPYLLG